MRVGGPCATGRLLRRTETQHSTACDALLLSYGTPATASRFSCSHALPSDRQPSCMLPRAPSDTHMGG